MHTRKQVNDLRPPTLRDCRTDEVHSAAHSLEQIAWMVRSIEKTDQQLMRSYKALEQSRELLKRVGARTIRHACPGKTASFASSEIKPPTRSSSVRSMYVTSRARNAALQHRWLSGRLNIKGTARVQDPLNVPVRPQGLGTPDWIDCGNGWPAFGKSPDRPRKYDGLEVHVHAAVEVAVCEFWR
jgi:hypothetical protein